LILARERFSKEEQGANRGTTLTRLQKTQVTGKWQTLSQIAA
jgi:hypothetical protein